jgi:hypothetical protein
MQANTESVPAFGHRQPALLHCRIDRLSRSAARCEVVARELYDAAIVRLKGISEHVAAELTASGDDDQSSQRADGDAYGHAEAAAAMGRGDV